MVSVLIGNCSYDGIFSTNVKCYASVVKFWKVFKLIRHENNNFGLEEPLIQNGEDF